MDVQLQGFESLLLPQPLIELLPRVLGHLILADPVAVLWTKHQMIFTLVEGVREACEIACSCCISLVVWHLLGRYVFWWLTGGIILGAVIPFTLIVIFPTNKKLLDSSLDKNSELATKLLIRWGRLHAVRSVLSLISFLIFIFLLRRNALR